MFYEHNAADRDHVRTRNSLDLETTCIEREEQSLGAVLKGIVVGCVLIVLGLVMFWKRRPLERLFWALQPDWIRRPASEGSQTVGWVIYSFSVVGAGFFLVVRELNA